VRSFILEAGTIGNTHFVAIPFNAAHQAGAMVLADFLMSPEAQAHKQDPRVWGDGTVLALDKLPADERARFAALPRGIATLAPEQLVPVRPEPHPSWMVEIEAEWLLRFSS
jgi:putative thiamine transport system substrate-binding protein